LEYLKSEKLRRGPITQTLITHHSSAINAHSSFDTPGKELMTRNDIQAGLRRRRRESKVELPRLVNRDYPYHQSRNRIAVRNENDYSHSQIWRLLMEDWFHVLLRIPVWYSVFALLAIWTVVILLFAAVYMNIDERYLEEDCGLGEPGEPIQFGTSFAFSLETCTTVGCKMTEHHDHKDSFFASHN
jgi:hypothetical protein